MDEKLKQKAEELKLEVNDDMSDDEVQKLIDAKEAELEELNKDKKTFSESEMKKAIAARDKAKKEMRKYKEKVEALEQKIDKSIDPDEVNSLKKELKELQDFKKEYDKKKEEEELKNLDEQEKIKIRFEKQMKALEEEIENLKNSKKEADKKVEEIDKKAEERIKRLRIKTLRADVVEEAAKYNVYSASQVFKLVKDDFEYDSDMEEFVHVVRNKNGKIIDEMTVSEYMKKFLEDKENENLIRSGVNKNSMHSNKQSSKTDKSFGSYNVKDPIIIRNARNNNMTPEQYIKRVLIPRDKIKNRKKGE